MYMIVLAIIYVYTYIECVFPWLLVNLQDKYSYTKIYSVFLHLLYQDGIHHCNIIKSIYYSLIDVVISLILISC